MSLLVVYNICGLSKDNTQEYIPRIKQLLHQEMYAINGNNIDIAISSCFNSEKCRRTLIEEFGSKITLIGIDERQAVNVTFNKTCQVMTELKGPYDGYIYVASDVNAGNYIIGTMVHRMNPLVIGSRNDIGMLVGQVDHDSGADYWLDGMTFPSNVDFDIPIGKTLSLHLQAFSKKIYDSFNRKVVPDVFVSYCSESIFSSICSSISQRFVVLGGDVANHCVSMDGNCRVFGGHQDAVYPGTPSINSILEKARKENIPLFYQSIFAKGSKWGERLHFLGDISQLDDNGFEPTGRLHKFLLDNFYLSKDVLDYDTLKYKIY